MSYAMTHWIVANEFAKKYKIPDKELFLVGAIAPDGVHQRSNYEKWMKQNSHYVPEGLEWGLIYEKETLSKWYENISKVYREKMRLISDPEAISFFQGVTIHIMVDVLNSIEIYGYALKKYGIEVLQLGSEYRKQCISADLKLYNYYNGSDEVISSIEEGLKRLKDSDILEKTGLAEEGFPDYNEISSFIGGVKHMYKNEMPEKTREDLISLETSIDFIKYSTEKCLELLFNFSDYKNTFDGKIDGKNNE